MKTKLPHIGIFWVYKSTVLAKAMPLNSTEPDSLSLYDSDFSHLVEWEEHRIYLPCFPELIAVEYQEESNPAECLANAAAAQVEQVLRGRVAFGPKRWQAQQQ